MGAPSWRVSIARKTSWSYLHDVLVYSRGMVEEAGDLDGAITQMVQ